MSKNSPTAAGQTRPATANKELVDAINQVFALFRRNYHNQYHKAFGDVEELNHVKRLWLEMLGRFSPLAILQGAKGVIENSEYLPTLHTMIHHCEQAQVGTAYPDPHTAYVEACRAPSPKAAFAWSHPLVYYTGKACDWYFLQSHSEAQAFPIFREKYAELCAKVRAGLILPPPQAAALVVLEGEPLAREVNLEKLAELRANLDL